MQRVPSQGQGLVIAPRSVVYDVPGLLKKLEPILECGWLTTGPKVAELEQEFMRRFDPQDRDVVVVSHGTAALQFVVRAYVPEGKKVIVPVNTFSASPAAVLLENRKVAFCDTDEWLQLDADKAMKMVKEDKEIKAIMAVHIAGNVSQRIDDLIQFCQERKIVLIEDLCQAFGTYYRGRPAGALSDFPGGCSISPTKVVFGPQGGFAVVRDHEIGGKMRQWRDNGKPWPGTDECESVTGNHKLGDLDAQVVLHQMQVFDEWAAIRRKNVKFLMKQLPEFRHLLIPGNVTNGYKHCMFLDPEGGIDGTQVEDMMRQSGIMRAGFCYRVPLHRTKAFRPLCFGRRFPGADKWCRYHFAVPVNHQFGELELSYIVHALRKAFDIGYPVG